jgi:ABC-type sugar transport system permease subunit
MIKQLRKSLVWYLFIAPTFILFGLFIAYPTLETFRLSFFREVVTQQEFAGAAQFLRLVTNQVFLGALLNTAFLGAAFLVLVIPLSLILALAEQPALRRMCSSDLLSAASHVYSGSSLVFSYVFNRTGAGERRTARRWVDPLPGRQIRALC